MIDLFALIVGPRWCRESWTEEGVVWLWATRKLGRRGNVVERSSAKPYQGVPPRPMIKTPVFKDERKSVRGILGMWRPVGDDGVGGAETRSLL